jgi:hypothetical protein
LKGIESEVQYRIGLIAQLENRAAANVPPFPTPELAPPMPGLAGISSEPTRQVPSRQTYAEANANDLRAQVMRGSMM